MKTEEMIRQLRANFTGDFNTDFAFLMRQMTRAKGSPEQEVMDRAGTELMKELLMTSEDPDDMDFCDDSENASDDWADELDPKDFDPDFPVLTAAELKETCQILQTAGAYERDPETETDEEAQASWQESISSSFELVLQLLVNDRWDEGEKILTSIIEELDKCAEKLEDKDVQCFSFEDMFQTALYFRWMEPEGNVAGTYIPFSVVYSTYGHLLQGEERLEEARAMYQKALEWNPADGTTQLALVSTYMFENDADTVFTMLRPAFRFLYKPEDIAEALNMMSWYFSEKGLELESAYCAYAACCFDPEAEDIDDVLDRISEETGEDIEEPDPELLFKMQEKYGFPCGVYPAVMELALTSARNMDEEMNDPESALYFMEIACSLTDDEILHDIRDALEESLPDHHTML